MNLKTGWMFVNKRIAEDMETGQQYRLFYVPKNYCFRGFVTLRKLPNGKYLIIRKLKY